VQIFDQKTIKMTRDEYRIRQVTKGEGEHSGGLAEKLDISAEVCSDGEEFNAAGQPGITIRDPGREGTKGITPPKSNWALPIDDRI